MIKKLYYLFHKLTAHPEERGAYSSGHWQELIRDAAFDICKNLKGKLLDVGCGEGLFLIPLASRNFEVKAWGVDNNSNRLKDARDKAKERSLENVELKFGDAAQLPFGDGYFDVVTCVNTFFNMPSIDAVRKALAEMKRVCKSGGRIIFDFRNSANKLVVLKYKFAGYYDDTVRNLPLNTFNQKEIIKMLEEMDLKVIEKRFVPASFAGPEWIRRMAPIIIIVAQKA